MSRALAFVVVLAMTFAARRALASSCDDLVASARTHESAGETDVALRQYNDAVALDPTCAAGWLGLGDLRAKTGDAAEAERVYNTALLHVPTLRTAIAGRARARWRLGRLDEAADDMREFVEHAQAGDPRAALAGLLELASWYASLHRAPAELACWRRIVSIARGVDDALEARARATSEALAIVVGPADPVTHPPRRDLLRSVAARLRLR